MSPLSVVQYNFSVLLVTNENAEFIFLNSVLKEQSHNAIHFRGLMRDCPQKAKLAGRL